MSIQSKYIFLLLVVSILFRHSFGQINHVYNGDFELYDECPAGVSTPFSYQLEHCLGWKVPTFATSDYFNTCANPASGVNVPWNDFGYQYPHNDNGYCGFYTYFYPLEFWVVDPWHEYIRGTINPPLQAGKNYIVSFYVSLGETSTYASSKIGAYISVDSTYRNDSYPFTYIPQVVNTTNNFIVDSAGWTLISGNYTASGGESYITMGWWGDTLGFDTLRVWPFLTHITSYYYIDDVSIVDTNSSYLSVPNVFTPNGDGVNDYWYSYTYKITTMQMVIYNRWGESVFEGNDKNSSWDGISGNRPCSDGTYFYTIQAFGEDGKKYNEKGFIQLMR